MKLRRQLAYRYGAIVAICFALLGGLIHHEFVTEPRERKALGIPELPETLWGEYAEVFFYSMIPLVLAGGYWFMHRTLVPLGELAEAVDKMDAGNLKQTLPRSGRGDEVDRLADVFNSMAARLDVSIQQLRHFTLHASHELKTPLAIMRIQLGTMLEGKSDLNAEQIEWLECELDEVQRLTRIVDALTLLTKADTGLVKLERKAIHFDELMREAFEDAQMLAESKGIQVKLTACEPVELLGDRDRLRQLLLNLTDNAIKYNIDGGQVSLALRNHEGSAELEVTNTGEGIPPETQAHVFDRFFRGEEARARAIEGCGLGLSICRWIVQAHNGRIELASELGKQTTIRVRLPISAATPVAVAA